MAGYFNKLRKKPKHVRDNIAFSIAGGFTLTVALAWFFVGFTGLGSRAEITAEEKPKAFSTLIDQIQDQVASAREGVSEAKKENDPVSVSNGDWGLSAQNSSSTNTLMPNEASIMIVNASSTRQASSTAATTSVLY